MSALSQQLKIYNTMSRKLELFEPITPGKVNLFCCGPTVYDESHLGHAKTFTQFDFIVRWLRHLGYEVFYLQNITNLDDKIIQRATERNISWEELTNEFETKFRADMEALGNTAVSEYARATDYLPQIIQQVQTLLDKGFAYQISDGIYFEITKFPGYGKLSGRIDQKQDDAVSRIDESSEKRGWNDFCLWKFSKPGEPVWEAPFGAGRPGWHIEDTAITEAFFGPQYDIHGGAIDLIFPHHEAEITQMEAASGRSPLVRYWMHGGFLNTGSTKMSKSLGNFTTISDALKQYDYRALRYFFLSTHYRSPLDLSEAALVQAAANVAKLDEFVFSIDPSYDDSDAAERIATLQAALANSLNDDFNTSGALAAIHEFMRAQNSVGKPGKYTLTALNDLNDVFGFMKFDAASNPSDDEIQTLVAKRDAHRAAKEFAEADALRQELEAKGIKLYDSTNGTKWRAE